MTAIALVLFTAMGCADLDQEPQNLATPQNYWTSQPNAISALAGDYALLKRALLDNSAFLKWGEFPAKTFMNSQDSFVTYIEDGNYAVPYSEGLMNWINLYKAANWALAIEDNVSAMPDKLFTSVDEKNRIIGEAAFIRSLSYFYLARVWGDAPIVREPITTADQLVDDNGYIIGKKRENELLVLNYALEAANKSIGLLSYSAPGTPRWAIQANKASAEALKAHITLWYASRNNNDVAMVNQSIAAATSVINNSNASLIDYVNEGVTGFDNMCKGASKTGLFEINISTDSNEAYRISNSSSTPTGLTLSGPFFATTNTSRPLIDPNYYGPAKIIKADPARANDVRRILFFDGYNPTGTYTVNPPNTAYLLKYSQKTKDSQSIDPLAYFSESNILIFRLADVYLLRAEGNMRLGNWDQAIADINIIRSKAGAANYTGAKTLDALTKCIFDERALEFVGEGHSAFDRLRLKYFPSEFPLNATRMAGNGYFWPVLIANLLADSQLQQTLWWVGRDRT